MTVQRVDISRLVSNRFTSAESAPAPVREALDVVDFGACPSSLADQEMISCEVRRGLRRVKIFGAVELTQFRLAAETLRLVRDLTSCQVRVEWSVVAAEHATHALHGLHPPVSMGGAPEKALTLWRERFRFGILYWRAGPGFAIIRDARQSAINHFTLDEAEYVDAVWRGHAGRGLADADASALRVLSNEGLIYHLGDFPVFLPYRMKHWPIPFNSV